MKKGLFEVAFYVSVAAGMAMGTSSFLMIGGAFQMASMPYVLGAIGVAALVCVLLSTVIAEVATLFPSAPGVRTYIKSAFGDGPSLFFVFLYLVFVLLVAGAESYMFGLVVNRVLPTAAPLLVALGLIWVVTLINWLGVTPSRSAQILTTAVLSVAVLGIGVWGAASGDGWQASSGMSVSEGLLSIPGIAGMAVFLFIGFEWVTPLGFKPDSYKRKVPLSMPAGIAVNLVLYVAFVVGIARWLPRDAIAETPMPQVPFLEALAGEKAGALIALALCLVATLSTFNAGIMGGARLLYALAREKRLPPLMAQFSLERSVPSAAILTLGALSTVSTLLIVELELHLQAAIVGSALVCFVYAAMVLSGKRLRAKPPGSRRPTFRSMLPDSVIALLAVAMVGIGLASLFAEPTYLRQTLVGAALSVAGAFALTRWSLRLGARPPSPAPAPTEATR